MTKPDFTINTRPTGGFSIVLSGARIDAANQLRQSLRDLGIEASSYATSKDDMVVLSPTATGADRKRITATAKSVLAAVDSQTRCGGKRDPQPSAFRGAC